MGVSIPASEPKHRRHHQEGCEADDGGEESPALAALYLYGDVLESVVERVPAPDLAAAAGVSREWLRAVRSALRRRPRRLPWLVEVHERGNWAACDPMPAALRESAAATWLSVAATDHRVYLADRTTGCASWFDPSMRRWGPTRRLKPDAGVSTWGVAPGRAGAEQLVLFGAKREGEGAKNKVVIQAWEVDGDTLDLPPGAGHDAMPSEMSARLFPHDEDEEDDGETLPSIAVCGNATGGYVYNSAEPANGAVLYELQEGKTGGAVERWEWVPCAPSVRAEPLGRVILACSPVGLDELELSRGLSPLGPQRACADVQ
ncbi:unnamed protein product [Triticum turgidum subsp. durum]|uniref:F-box domain-containing protein n=1 Tax=Triticum turgidum subsp. durum TaxID=4567 RepID=A0A9R1QJG2_TRITD|nr:unnamed protein product [Triticum turgidum subsp. durum]